MKYLVNRETKEHQIASEIAASSMERYPSFAQYWKVVEADSEGWIEWSGGECPLPDDCQVETQKHNGKFFGAGLAMNRAWECIAAYRPVPSEPAPEIVLRTKTKHGQSVTIEQPLDTQVAGDHYKKLKIQPVEYIHGNGIGFIEGSVIKYVTRWRDKGGIDDLRKARHFIDLLIDLELKNDEA